jgi:hypothetical protein
MKAEFPMRVRCVEGNHFFRRGDEYTALRTLGVNLCVIDYPNSHGLVANRSRFKPIVRRVAGSVRI